MNAFPDTHWLDQNQAYLKIRLQRLRFLMKAYLSEDQNQEKQENQRAEIEKRLGEIHTSMNQPPAIETLAATFGLSEFECDVLLLGVGIELDAAFANDVHAINGNSGGATFALALSMLSTPHWSALTGNAPLRHFHLIQLQTGNGFITTPYRVDEKILHYLAGINELDSRMSPCLQLLPPPEIEISLRYESAIKRLASVLSCLADDRLVQIRGDTNEWCRIAVSLACLQAGKSCYRLLPGAPVNDVFEFETFARLWARESLLCNSVLLVELRDDHSPAQLTNLVTHLKGHVIYSGEGYLNSVPREITLLDTPEPTKNEFIALWQQAGEPVSNLSEDSLARLANQFHLGFDDIRAIGSSLRGSDTTTSPEELEQQLWCRCRLQARRDMDSLAHLIEPIATWEDLVLPNQAIETLKHIASQVRHKLRVYDEWGFRRISSRGLGISALFAGDSGTGKTMAAEVIADELQLDLYRIDLSQVVSKYIGETEKNLKKVFDAAERSGSILLFDEADALFGKRSEVKDSHDRYANIEISFLLQRMESYSGLAILTTNLRKTIDPAFLRRLRFVVHFPFPTQEERTLIWQRMFPRETPVNGLEYGKLGRLNIAGGNIRNIAMNAAFIAASTNSPVTMEHVLQAGRVEYIKTDRLLNESEWRGFT